MEQISYEYLLFVGYLSIFAWTLYISFKLNKSLSKKWDKHMFLSIITVLVFAFVFEEWFILIIWAFVGYHQFKAWQARNELWFILYQGWIYHGSDFRKEINKLAPTMFNRYDYDELITEFKEHHAKVNQNQ